MIDGNFELSLEFFRGRSRFEGCSRDQRAASDARQDDRSPRIALEEFSVEGRLRMLVAFLEKARERRDVGLECGPDFKDVPLLQLIFQSSSVSTDSRVLAMEAIPASARKKRSDECDASSSQSRLDVMLAPETRQGFRLVKARQSGSQPVEQSFPAGCSARELEGKSPTGALRQGRLVPTRLIDGSVECPMTRHVHCGLPDLRQIVADRKRHAWT